MTAQQNRRTPRPTAPRQAPKVATIQVDIKDDFGRVVYTEMMTAAQVEELKGTLPEGWTFEVS